MILVTQTFQKALSKIKSVNFNDILSEIKKHSSGLQNFIEIWEIDTKKVLKWYLNSKKVRLVVLFKENNWNYFPFYIVKKETKQWYNISKQSLKLLEGELDKHYEDLEKWDFEKINL